MVRHSCTHAAHATVLGSTDLTHHVVFEAGLTTRLERLVSRRFFEHIEIAVKRFLDGINLGNELVINDSLELGLVLGIEVVVTMVFDGSSQQGVVRVELSGVASLEDQLLTRNNRLL